MPSQLLNTIIDYRSVKTSSRFFEFLLRLSAIVSCLPTLTT